MFEKAFFEQLTVYLISNKLFERFLSSFRSHHSTETALVWVVNEILVKADIITLLNRLKHYQCVEGKVLSWIRSFFLGRSQIYYTGVDGPALATRSVSC